MTRRLVPVLLSALSQLAWRCPAAEPVFLRGADLSFLPEMEQRGMTYLDADGHPVSALECFRRAGCNTVRIRLWNHPADAHSSLDEVSALAKRVRAAGMKVWLDFHYSDTWADPGSQAPPAAWKDLPTGRLGDEIESFTRNATAAVRPDIVQTGNEINGGFLWPAGRRGPHSGFARLLQRAVHGVRSAAPQAIVMIHYAGLDGSQTFFRELHDQHVEFDWIGLSFYPRWHGKDLDAVTTTLRDLRTRFHQPVMLAEIAYPFTFSGSGHHVIGLPEQIHPDDPATPAGQRAFLLALRRHVEQAGGSGFCYWAPDWLSPVDPSAKPRSAWENQALFDLDHRQLPGMELFHP